MKRTLLSAAVFAAAALAPAAMAQDSDWTGLYVGGHVGHAFKADDESIMFDTDADGIFDDTVRTSSGADAFAPGFCGGAALGATPADGCRKNSPNINYSVRVGFDVQFDNWVVGVVGEHTAVNLGDDVTGFTSTPAASYTFTRDLNSLTSARLRAGYAQDTGLLYGTAGVAWGDMDQSFTTTNTVNTFVPSEESEVEGYQVGIGYEVKLEPMWLIGSGWTLAVEYLWTSLDEGFYPVRVGQGTAPATNPFILQNAAGTAMERTKDVFEFSNIGVSLNWRL